MTISIKNALTCLLVVLTTSVFAQVSTIDHTANPIEVTVNKATSITFSSNIIDGIKVSREIMSQKVNGVNNVLLLTARHAKFRETNLTVITGDRKLHHFTIRYADRPADFTISADEGNDAVAPPLQLTSDMTETELQQASEKIIAAPQKFHKKTTAKFGMRLTLRGIYIEGNVMFYHMEIENTSNIPYHPEMLRLFVKDKKQSKRTASQEVSQTPIYKYGNGQVIAGRSRVDLVYALPKFTIPDAKLLNIELMEHHGGRNLLLKIKNRLIVKALTISK